jgi:hypothetical protein
LAAMAARVRSRGAQARRTQLHEEPVEVAEDEEGVGKEAAAKGGRKAERITDFFRGTRAGAAAPAKGKPAGKAAAAAVASAVAAEESKENTETAAPAAKTVAKKAAKKKADVQAAPAETKAMELDSAPATGLCGVCFGPQVRSLLICLAAGGDATSLRRRTAS